MARDDYETRKERQFQGVQLAKQAGKYLGRQANKGVHKQIIALRKSGSTITQTASIAGCSVSQVKRIWAIHKKSE
ncbi:MAG: recombinase family protein [Alteromonadaceae bacterium]|nr:recombinase family protein [Alteromonadaceae bacterium]